MTPHNDKARQAFDAEVRKKRYSLKLERLLRNSVFQLTCWVLLMLALVLAWFGDFFALFHDIQKWFHK